MSGGLVTPHRVEGRVEWHEHRDLSDRLRHGDATLGWGGDPTMRLLFNGEDVRWEVWGRMSNGQDGMMVWRDGRQPPGLDLIRALVAGDTRHIDIVGDALRANDARDAAVIAAGRDRSSEAADRLAHALAKDLDLPAPAGKLYPLS